MRKVRGCLSTLGFLLVVALIFWIWWKFEGAASSGKVTLQQPSHLLETNFSHIRGYKGKQVFVHRKFAPHLEKLNAFCKSKDLHLLVISSYRYEQDNLKNAIVKPATFSNHLVGCALDCNVQYKGTLYNSTSLRQSNLAKLPERVRSYIAYIQKDTPLRWGGTFNDPVHIDLPINKQSRSTWHEWRKGCAKDWENATKKPPALQNLRKLARKIRDRITAD